MIKRDIVETVYEYDKEGKLLKKTITETHEEEKDTITINPGWQYLNDYYATTSTNVVNKCSCDGHTALSNN